MGVLCGCVRWVCYVGVSGGCVFTIKDVLGGCIRWVCQVGVYSL